MCIKKTSLMVAIIASTLAVAGCGSSHPDAGEIQEGVKQWLLMSFNLSSNYGNIPQDKLNIKVSDCMHPSMDEFKSWSRASSMPEKQIDKLLGGASVCVVEIANTNKLHMMALHLSNKKWIVSPFITADSTQDEKQTAIQLFNQY